MDLDSYKYVELQRLAKDVGLKANMKVNRVSKVKHDPETIVHYMLKAIVIPKYKNLVVSFKIPLFVMSLHQITI